MPSNPGAETAPLRENRLSRDFRALPARTSHLGLPPAEGRAPHARKGGLASGQGMAPLGPRAFVCPQCLWFASACVRPCHTGAETAPLREESLGVISDLSPHGHPCWASPPAEGRAPHARKQSSCASEACHKEATGYSPNPLPIMKCLGIRGGRIKRAHRVRPSEKTALHVVARSSPISHP